MVLTALLTAVIAHQQREPPPAALTPVSEGQRRTSLHEEDYIPEGLHPSRKDDLVLGGWSPWAQTLWHTALKEENITNASQTSYYARQMVKFPRSWIRQLRELSHDKRHNFNFIGRPNLHRDWIANFAKANFSDGDVFEYTGQDVEKWGIRRAQLGPWDVTNHNGNHSRVRENTPRTYSFDREYFQVISSSNLTLCPAGDHPYAMRFIDAIAAGSLPVVRSVAKDVDSPFSMLTSIPFHYIAFEDGTPLVYRQDWVDENTELFMRYCTFIEGDNIPSDWQPPAGMKEAIDAAEGASSTRPS